MSILLWIIFGAIVGGFASLMTKTGEPIGTGGNVIVGILGALLGGWIVTIFGGTALTGFSLLSLAVSLLGAAILLAIVRGFTSPMEKGL